MATIVAEIEICSDCTLLVANGEIDHLSEADQEAHTKRIAERWGPGQPLVLACGVECEGFFSWSSCEGCGSALGGDRHPAVVFRLGGSHDHRCYRPDPRWALDQRDSVRHHQPEGHHVTENENYAETAHRDPYSFAGVAYRVSYSVPSLGDIGSKARSERVSLESGDGLGEIAHTLAYDLEIPVHHIRIESIECVSRTDYRGGRL